MMKWRICGEWSLLKILVVYESKYGNTKHVAETIIESLKEKGETDISLVEAKKVNFNIIPSYDLFLIGSPNHIGGPTRGIKSFVDKLGKLQLKGKMFAVFDTYIGGDYEKAARKLEKRVKEKAPGMRQIAPVLSIRVQGIKGPIVEGEFPKCKAFGKHIAAQLNKASNQA